jgi:hypothetical protein
MTPTPEMLALAREICASFQSGDVARRYLEGVYDADDEMRVALAAIQRTTELAAKFVDDRGFFLNASALRNFNHLKGAV